MQKSRHICLVAGEESGDLHAAALVRQLKAAYPDMMISGIGGKHMENAGVTILSDLAKHGVTGFTEVFRHLKVIYKAFRIIQSHLKTHKPDLLILIDYPGFNLRLAKFAKRKLNLKVLYYISPQIWAWKANRIHVIKECVDKMAVILPFEKSIYEQAGVPVSFVGHPLVEQTKSFLGMDEARQQLQLPKNVPIIGLLPGSRKNEILRLMPVLRDTAIQLLKENSNLQFVIPIAGTIEPEQIQSYLSHINLPIHLIKGQALTCMAAANFVVVASGTASLECALLAKPMCIIYKCSRLTYLAHAKLNKARYLGLSNLLLNKMLVPEFLQHDCNPIELTHYISRFLAEPSLGVNATVNLSVLKAAMSDNQADCSLFDLVASELPKINA